jgi:hypothetical protein
MEPTLHNGGFEVYERGLHRAYSNILWRQGAAACGQGRWQHLLRAFVDACRDPSAERIDRLREANGRCLAASTDETVDQLLMLVPPRTDWLQPRIAMDMGHGIGMRDLLDPAVTSLIENCIAWPERVGPIQVLHDESSVVARWRVKLEVLAGPDAAEAVGEYWNNLVPYPLAIDEIRLVRSEDSARIQLADVLAGAAATWLGQFVPNSRTNPEFIAALADAGVEELIQGEVWPQPEQDGARF